MKTADGRMSGKRFLAILGCVMLSGISGCIFDGESDVDVAWSALKKGDLNQSIRFSSRAINFGGLAGEKLGSAYECRATANSQKDKYDRALSDLDKLVELRPGYAGAYLTRGDVLLHARDFDRALADIDKGLQIADPKGESKSMFLAKRYISRGSIWLAKNNTAKAMADFDRALILEPASLDARMGRSYVLESLGQKREALVEMELVWQSVSRRVFMPLDRQSSYLRRVISLRMANGFDGATPANVIPAEAAPIPVPASEKAETENLAEAGGPGESAGSPDGISEKNLDKPLLGK